MKGPYTTDFYEGQRSGSRRSADRVVPLIIDLIGPRSVVDVGCGVGTWLASFSHHGVKDVIGVDGEYVDRKLLQIPKEQFIGRDLTQPIGLERRFDLVCCLEVAEHLDAAFAGTLVDSLAGLGPVVLFSAAAPYQGGTNHVNEQWPEYWAELFQKRGYSPIDYVRPTIWNDPDVEWWYAQNALLFAAQAHLDSLGTEHVLYRLALATAKSPLSLVHPRCYTEKALALRLCKDVMGIAPPNESLILVAESVTSEFPLRNALPFLERDGVYWGHPASGQEAIQELERMRASGCSFIVFSWLSFWWLDYYSDLRDHLRTHFKCVNDDECFIAFDLRRTPS